MNEKEISDSIQLGEVENDELNISQDNLLSLSFWSGVAWAEGKSNFRPEGRSYTGAHNNSYLSINFVVDFTMWKGFHLVYNKDQKDRVVLVNEPPPECDCCKQNF